MTVFVSGLEAAAGLVAAAGERPLEFSDVRGPFAATHGWWCVALHTDPYPGELLALAGGVPAIVVQGASGPMALVSLADADGQATMLIGDCGLGGGVDAERLARWSLHAPKPMSLRAVRRWLRQIEGRKGSEIEDALLRRLGFGAARRGDPWEDLPGATFRVNFEPGFLGVEPYDPRRYRWRFARTKDGVGMWDFDGPSEPVERWRWDSYDPPMLAEEEAKTRWWQLVALPTLRNMVLDGDRAWGRHERVTVDGTRVRLLVFLHRSPAGVVVEANCEPPYNTRWRVLKDGFQIRKEEAHRLGVEGPEDPTWPSERYLLPNRDFADAKFAARIKHSIAPDFEWTDVPETVSRSFFDTCAYVRSINPR